jgi:hypothetical protein
LSTWTQLRLAVTWSKSQGQSFSLSRLFMGGHVRDVANSIERAAQLFLRCADVSSARCRGVACMEAAVAWPRNNWGEPWICQVGMSTRPWATGRRPLGTNRTVHMAGLRQAFCLGACPMARVPLLVLLAKAKPRKLRLIGPAAETKRGHFFPCDGTVPWACDKAVRSRVHRSTATGGRARSTGSSQFRKLLPGTNAKQTKDARLLSLYEMYRLLGRWGRLVESPHDLLVRFWQLVIIVFLVCKFPFPAVSTGFRTPYSQRSATERSSTGQPSPFRLWEPPTWATINRGQLLCYCWLPWKWNPGDCDDFCPTICLLDSSVLVVIVN